MIDRFDRPTVLAVATALCLAAAITGSVLVDSPTTRGVLIGVALGLVNLILGAHFTRRSLEGEPGAVLVNIAAGFGARFVVLMALLVIFTFVPGLGVSPAAFGFTFVAFVFVYFGIESAFALRFQQREAA